jgi:fatty-acid desaturase
MWETRWPLFSVLGLNVGFHRLLTHRGFSRPLWLEHTLAILGTQSLQFSPALWVAVNRRHHHGWPSSEALSELTSDPVQFWMHMGEQWQKNWMQMMAPWIGSGSIPPRSNGH